MILDVGAPFKPFSTDLFETPEVWCTPSHASARLTNLVSQDVCPSLPVLLQSSVPALPKPQNNEGKGKALR